MRKLVVFFLLLALLPVCGRAEGAGLDEQVDKIFRDAKTVGGAFLVANSQKAREAVKTSQEQIKEKAEELTKNCQCGKKSDE